MAKKLCECRPGARIAWLGGRNKFWGGTRSLFMWIREGHRSMRNLSRSGSNEQGEDQKFRVIFRSKSEIQPVFSAKNRWSPKKKKKVFTEIRRDFPPKIGNSNSFSGRKQVVSKKKKKVFPEIQRDFPAEIRNSNAFSGRKQVISKKKKKKKRKGLHPKNVMKSGVSPQKLRKYRWQTPIWASICTPIAPSLVVSSGHSYRLGGTIFVWGRHKQSFGGVRPRNAPPWRRAWMNATKFWKRSLNTTNPILVDNFGLNYPLIWLGRKQAVGFQVFGSDRLSDSVAFDKPTKRIYRPICFW